MFTKEFKFLQLYNTLLQGNPEEGKKRSKVNIFVSDNNSFTYKTLDPVC